MSDLPSRTLLFAYLSIALAGAHGCNGKTLAIRDDAGAAGRGASNEAGGADGGALGGTEPGGAAGADGGALGGTEPGGAAGANGGALEGTEPGGAAGANGGALEPVRIVRGQPEQTYWDLTVRGADLEEYEGKHVRVRLGMPDHPAERLGSGDALIESGAFELFFPSVWQAGLYQRKLVFIDVDGDGSCDPVADKVFQDARGSNAPELVVREPARFALFDIRASSNPETDCAIFNSSWPEG